MLISNSKTPSGRLGGNGRIPLTYLKRSNTDITLTYPYLSIEL